MWNVGVRAGDSRDFLGQKRFFPFSPENVLIGKYMALGVISGWLFLMESALYGFFSSENVRIGQPKV